MFTNNKYLKWYYNIIDAAKTRSTDRRVENHHIIPKSLGGDNSKDNLVRLLPREHFICHILLTKFTSGADRRKMIFASNRMCYGKNRYVPNGRIYESIRNEALTELHKNNTGAIRSAETCQKISISRKNKGTGQQSPEHIEKRAAALRGGHRNCDTKATMSKNRQGKPQSQAHIESRRKSLIGKIRSKESKERYTKSKIGALNPNAKPVEIRGKLYNTKKEACIDLCISRRELNKLLICL